MNKPVVCYLFTVFDKLESLKDFKKNYQNYKSGFDHDLLICFKLIHQDKLKIILKELNGLKYIKFIDPQFINDYDFGSYKRVCQKFPDRDILFLNSHSYPICNHWLQKLMKHKKNDNLIGITGSYESITDSVKFKKIYKVFSYLFRLYKFKKHFLNFPNPHIRTANFLIRGEIFLEYIKDKKIDNKFDAWKVESGKKSLTNFFKSKNMDIFIVNSDGEKFSEKNWKISNTYKYLNQENLIISDKHTRGYLASSVEKKKIIQKNTWGN